MVRRNRTEVRAKVVTVVVEATVGRKRKDLRIGKKGRKKIGKIKIGRRESRERRKNKGTGITEIVLVPNRAKNDPAKRNKSTNTNIKNNNKINNKNNKNNKKLKKLRLIYNQIIFLNWY